MNDIFEAKRKRLEDNVKTATLELFGHMGADTFALPLDKTSKLFVVAGNIVDIYRILKPLENK